MRRDVVLLVLALGLVACRPSRPPERTYELRGQVVAVRPDIREVRLAHEEIPGYMAPMTMSFGVKDARLLEGLVRGDLIHGTLVVTETDAWISTLEKTGHGAVVDDTEQDAAASAPAQPAPDLLEVGQDVPDERFLDQDGQTVAIADGRGKAVALTFIYTRCPLPTFCPRLDRHFLAAQQRVGARPDLRGKVLFLTVSFDPGFDTPAVLKQHAAAVGADEASWRFLTGDAAAIDRFATRFGVSVVRNETDAADITHNLRTAVIAPNGRVAALLSGGEWTPDELVESLAAALGS